MEYHHRTDFAAAVAAAVVAGAVAAEAAAVVAADLGPAVLAHAG